jgi:hypothetical protein
VNDLTPQQIKDAVLKGLKQVGRRFAKNPRPTDGSVRSALVIAARVRPKPGRSDKRAVLGGKSS